MDKVEILYWFYLGPVNLYYIISFIYFWRAREHPVIKKALPFFNIVTAASFHTANLLMILALLIPSVSCAAVFFLWHLVVNVGLSAVYLRSVHYHALCILAVHNINMVRNPKSVVEKNWIEQNMETFQKRVLPLLFVVLYIVQTIPYVVNISSCVSDFSMPYVHGEECTCDGYYGLVLTIQYATMMIPALYATCVLKKLKLDTSVSTNSQAVCVLIAIFFAARFAIDSGAVASVLVRTCIPMFLAHTFFVSYPYYLAKKHGSMVESPNSKTTVDLTELGHDKTQVEHALNDEEGYRILLTFCREEMSMEVCLIILQC